MAETKAGRLGRAIIVFVFAAVAIAARRPDQIVRPDVWNEDGVMVIPQIIEHGWASLFIPVNGYFIVTSRLISLISMSISFEYYHILSTVLGLFFQAGCVTALALAPTRLPLPVVMGLSALFVASDPEVFLLPQYSFWWAGLLLLPALFWQDSGSQLTRLTYVVVGGVSSPFVVLIAPVFALDAAVRRSQASFLTLITVLLFACLQGAQVLASGSGGHLTENLLSPGAAIAAFFGSWFGKTTFTGLVVAAILVFGLGLIPRQERLDYLLLLLCLAAAVVAALGRSEAWMLDAVEGGPRYFFYPFVIETWLLIWLVLRASPILKLVPAVPLVAAAVMLVPNLVRTQSALEPWNEQVARCLGDGHRFEVQYDGRDEPWHVVLSAEQCRNARERSLV